MVGADPDALSERHGVVRNQCWGVPLRDSNLFRGEAAEEDHAEFKGPWL